MLINSESVEVGPVGALQTDFPPRPRYDVRRWSSVFPMGMTAVATLAVADALDVFRLRGPGQVLLWIAVAAWLAAVVGTVLAFRSAVRRPAR